MKNICIIAGTLSDSYILKPLIREFQKDPCVYLTVISAVKQQTPEMEITCIRWEEEGFMVDEKTIIRFVDPDNFSCSSAENKIQIEYGRILKQLNPDIAVLMGNRYETFSAAIAASGNNIPIAHIQGGESDFGPWDDSYGYGITKLSHLHFTATEKYRQQVIRFGENPDSVFNVGSLLVEKINRIPLKEKRCFCNEIGLNPEDRFLLISFHPDTTLGSRNRDLFQEILNSLTDDRLKHFKIVLNMPRQTGLGKMIIQMITAFSLNHPGKIFPAPFMNLTDLSCAIKYCSVLVGNGSEGIVIAPSFKTPVVNVGTRQQGKIKADNIIDSFPQKEEICCAVQNGLSTDFHASISNMSSPFERVSPSKTIKNRVKEFNRTDLNQKTVYLLKSNAG